MPEEDAEAFDAVVVDLYAVAPQEFTAARDSRARDAEGDLRRGIAALRKPAVSAWVVDLLAREGLLDEAIALGAALQEAQEELDAAELTRLGAQRRQLVGALARTGSDLAAQRGVTVSASAHNDVERTLNAALIDRNAAAAVRTGRLAKPLEAGGAGGLSVADALSGSAPPVHSGSPPDDDLAGARARKAAERRRREAEHAAERAERDRHDAEAKRDRAQERADRLRERVDALRRDLDHAQAEADEAQRDLEALKRTAETAAREARSAAERARGLRDRIR